MDYESPLRYGRPNVTEHAAMAKGGLCKIDHSKFNQHYPRMRVLQREIDHVARTHPHQHHGRINRFVCVLSRTVTRACVHGNPRLVLLHLGRIQHDQSRLPIRDQDVVLRYDRCGTP
jgi:hypothetical protein